MVHHAVLPSTSGSRCMRRRLRICNGLFALSLGLAAAAPPASAQGQAVSAVVASEFRVVPRALVTAPVDNNRLVSIPGALHPAVARAISGAGSDLGPVEDALPMEHLQLLLRRTPERQAAFDAQVEALHQRGTTSFHQWLTPELVGEAFGPAQSDLAALSSWLAREGFQVNRFSKSGLIVDFSGTAGQLRASFHTEIHRVTLANGEPHIAAVREAQIPEAFSSLLRGFVSMSDIGPTPMVKKLQPPPSDPLAMLRPAYVDSSGFQHVGAQDFYTIYNELPLLQPGPSQVTGTGQTIALIEETDIVTADVTNFRAKFAVISSPPNLTVLHGGGGVACTDPGITSKNEESEAVLDTEWAGAVAPGASLLFMACRSTRTTSGTDLSAEAVVDGNLAQVMSLSYGASEKFATAGNAAFYTDLWEQAASQGITVVVSSGDSGSDVEDQGAKVATNGLNVNLFSSTAWNVSAGGTDFQDRYNGGSHGVSTYWSPTNGPGDLSALSYIPETTWNGTCASSLLDAYLEGSGSALTSLCDDLVNAKNYAAPDGGSGGASVYNPRPAWQNSTVYGLPSTSQQSSRLQPDVSFFASNGVWGHALAYFQSDVSSGLQLAGGTSFTAPQLAGVFALIAQSTGQRLGQPNYVLYNLAGTEYGTTTFNTARNCNGSGADNNGVTTTTPDASCVFYDVRTGNNSQACAVGSTDCYADSGAPYGLLSTDIHNPLPAYNALPGWDFATGIGSLNIANLVAGWKAANGGPAFTPTVTVSVNPTGCPYGEPVALALAATVAGSASFPTGSIQFQVNGTNIASPVVLQQSAGCATGGLCTETAPLTTTLPATTAAGTSSITAVYLPTNESYSSATGSATLLIAKQAPTLTVANASTPQGSVSTVLTASLAYAGTGSAPSGTVTLQVDSGPIVTAACTTANPEVCTTAYPTVALGTGAHTITAVYSGDANYSAATGTGTLTVTAGVGNPGEIWVTNAAGSGIGTTTALSPAGVALSGSPFSGGGVGIAIDHAGDVWTLNKGANTLAILSSTGASINPAAGAGAGIAAPTSLAIDGLGQVWIANGNGTVSVLNSSGAPLWGVAAMAGGSTSAPTGITIDISGNVWIANAGTNSVIEILGAAAPAPPLAIGVTNNALGTRP